MQLGEFQDQLLLVGEDLPLPSADSFDKVVIRARKRRRRRRALAIWGIAGFCAAIAVPIGYATSTTSPEIVRVGPLTRPHPQAKIPAVVVNTIREFREPLDSLDRLDSVSMKVMPWQDLARYVPKSKHWASPDTKVYAVLQTGSNVSPSGEGVPRQQPYHWQIIVLNLDNSAQLQILDLPKIVRTKGKPGYKTLGATVEPPYWRSLPGPEYVLDLKTGKVERRSNSR